MTALENGEGDGNSSVVELELRVEMLEGTVADHEKRISFTESNVTGKPPVHQSSSLLFSFVLYGNY